MARLVILGGSGFVGRHVLAKARDAGHETASLSRREGCDFDEVDSLIGRLAELKPEVVVNCGAQVGSVHHVSEKAA
ncbi:MAG: NAD-dependent epimerase/dehydratase family protein, partial [bacterium]|nr:NAD-dependent epimerase/dehydratase family protein [bacterium]